MGTWGTPHIQAGTSGLGYLNPLNYDTGASEFFWGQDNPNFGISQPQFQQTPNQSTAVPVENGKVLGITQEIINKQINPNQDSGGSRNNPPPGNPPPDPGQQRNPLQDYIDSLNSQYGQMESSLNPMYSQQEGAINQQYQGGLRNIDLQAQEGQRTLDGQTSTVQTNQTNNLRDLADAVRNSYQSFSNQLGAYGAGDSSASNVMLPYALSRMEAKQRGNVTQQTGQLLGDIEGRRATLNNAVMQEKNKLDMEKGNQLSQLAQWFNQAKSTLAQQKGANVIQGSQQILQNAINEMNNINNAYSQKQSALQQWAMNNSTNLGALKSNMAAMTDPSLLGTLPTYGQLPTQVQNQQSAQQRVLGNVGQTDDKEWWK